MRKTTVVERGSYGYTLRVKMRPEDAELLRTAAASAGARSGGRGDVSSWARQVLVAAARRELEQVRAAMERIDIARKAQAPAAGGKGGGA